MGSLFERVVWWLRPPEERRFDPLWVALRERGASRELVRYAEPFGDDLDGAWRGCPRPDWVIEIATRVGVQPARLVHALAEVAEASAAVEAARAFADGSLALDGFLDAVGAAMSDAIEARPEVRSALAASRAAGRERHAAALHELDQVYATAQRELAEGARRRLSSEDVRVALQGMGAHPYR